MRKSTLIVLAILVGAFALLMYLANSSLGMWRPDLEAAQELTRRFQERGDLAPGSRVRLRRVEGSGERKGPGLHVEVAPSATVLGQPGGMTLLLRGLTLDALAAYPPDAAVGVGWFRVTVELPGSEPRVVWFDRPEDGSIQGPTPPLPATWPERPAPPAPPADPAPAPGPAPAPLPAPAGGR